MNTLLSAITLILFFASNGFAQSLYSIRPDSSGSFLDGEPGLEDSVEGESENTTGSPDEISELRMRYPELYGGNLAAGNDAGDDEGATGNSLGEGLEMQTRYPELYLNNRLYDEDAVLSIGKGEQE